MSLFTPVIEIDVDKQPVEVDGAVDANITNPSLAVTGPLTDTELRATPVDVLGPLTDAELRAAQVEVISAVSTVSNITRVNVTASVQLLAANASRKKTIVFNEGNGLLYVKLGDAASVTDYTYQLGKLATLEFDTHTGIVSAISSASSTIQVTELA